MIGKALTDQYCVSGFRSVSSSSSCSFVEHIFGSRVEIKYSFVSTQSILDTAAVLGDAYKSRACPQLTTSTLELRNGAKQEFAYLCV